MFYQRAISISMSRGEQIHLPSGQQVLNSYLVQVKQMPWKYLGNISFVCLLVCLFVCCNKYLREKNERRDGLMVSMLDSGSSGPG